MSTVDEIERAIGQLSPEQRMEIRRWLDWQTPKPEAAGGAAVVNWSQSASVTRRRLPDLCLPAEVMIEALAAVRE